MPLIHRQRMAELANVTPSARPRARRLWTTPRASIPFCFCRRWWERNGADPCSPALLQSQTLACAPSSSRRAQDNAVTSSPMACGMPSAAGLLPWEDQVGAPGTGRSSTRPSQREEVKRLSDGAASIGILLRMSRRVSQDSRSYPQSMFIELPA